MPVKPHYLLLVLCCVVVGHAGQAPLLLACLQVIPGQWQPRRWVKVQTKTFLLSGGNTRTHAHAHAHAHTHTYTLKLLLSPAYTTQQKSLVHVWTTSDKCWWTTYATQQKLYAGLYSLNINEYMAIDNIGCLVINSFHLIIAAMIPRIKMVFNKKNYLVYNCRRFELTCSVVLRPAKTALKNCNYTGCEEVLV